MEKIKKPVALITGATGCIGGAIVKRMISDGFFVLGIDKNEKKGATMIHEVGENNFRFYAMDVSSYGEIKSLFAGKFLNINKIEVVVTCAGILEMEKVDCFSVKSWDKTIGINLTGTFYFLKECLRLMKKSDKGIIIPIGSRWGISGARNAAAYSASKSALRALVKSVQLECVDTKIRCVLVSPGSVASDMSNYVKNDIEEKLLANDDIANLISYIAKTPDYVIFDEIVIKAFPYDFLN
jgi:3alpha(or 20beta)-hydroxysteroid dehydrogenase